MRDAAWPDAAWRREGRTDRRNGGPMVSPCRAAVITGVMCASMNAGPFRDARGTMAVLMFWNVNKRGNGEAIGQLCREHDVDVLLLAEAETPSARLTTEINDATGSRRMMWELPHLGSRVRAFTRFTPGLLESVFDDGGHVKILHL